MERGREMYSAEIYKEEILKMKRLVKAEDPRLAKRLEECNRLLLEMKRECENYTVLDEVRPAEEDAGYQVVESVSHVALKLMNVFGELERFLEECQDPKKREEILEFYFQVRDF